MYWIKRELCTGCLDCLDACNVVGALVVHHGLPAIDATRCASCGACARACPVVAIVAVPTDTPSRHKPVETLEIDAPSHSESVASREIVSHVDQASVEVRTGHTSVPMTKRDRLAEIGITPERTVQVLKAIGTVGGTIIAALASQRRSILTDRVRDGAGSPTRVGGDWRGHRRRGRRRGMR